MSDISNFIDELYMDMGYAVRRTEVSPDQYHRLLNLGMEPAFWMIKLWTAVKFLETLEN